MRCEIKIAANANLRAPRAFYVFEHFPCCTWNFAVYLNNYHALNSNVIMLLTSCIDFNKNILHIKVFIPILKVAG